MSDGGRRRLPDRSPSGARRADGRGTSGTAHTSRPCSRWPTVAGVRVRGVLFDFGNTLFANAPLTDRIADGAGRLGRDIIRADAAERAGRIDELAASEAEAVHRRDLDAAV